MALQILRKMVIVIWIFIFFILKYFCR